MSKDIRGNFGGPLALPNMDGVRHRFDYHATYVPGVRSIFRLGVTIVVLGAAGLSLQAWLPSHSWRSAGFAAAAAVAPLLIVLLLLVALVGIVVALRPKRTAQQALVVVASSDTLIALSSSRPGMALAGAVGLTLLVTARSLWSELSDMRASRNGRMLLAAAGILVVTLFLIERPKGALVALTTLLLIAALLTAFWALLLLVRNAPFPSVVGPLDAVYSSYAEAGVSPFALMHDKRYYWNRSRTAFLAYATRAGAAVVLGPGIGPRDSLTGLYQEFRAEAHRRGWRVAFYQLPVEMANALGWGQRYQVGSEAIVDLDALTLDGPVMAKVRHEVSRGKRNGVTVTLLPDAEVTQADRAAMRSLKVLGRRRRVLGDMAFSVGRRGDVPEVPTTVGLAHNAQGELVAYASWLGLPAARGVALDAMRRRPDAPGGTMDLLLYSGMQEFKQKAAWASLGLAPAAGPSAASLFAFKARFRPRWEPRYVVAERLIDWPATGIATLLVHYPDLRRSLSMLMPSPVSWLRGAA